MQYLVQFDHSLFQLLNSQLVNGFFDWFMPFITDAKTWMPFVLFAWLFFICTGGRQAKILALALLLSVGLTDVICARVFKKAVGRLRPCAIEQTENFKCRLLLPKKTSKSFPSNHAANTAAFAAATAVICGLKPAVPLILLAFLIGYSRIYVGVHFPLDVLAGWIAGIAIAVIISRFIKAKFMSESCESCKQPEVAALENPDKSK